MKTRRRAILLAMPLMAAAFAALAFADDDSTALFEGLDNPQDESQSIEGQPATTLSLQGDHGLHLRVPVEVGFLTLQGDTKTPLFSNDFRFSYRSGPVKLAAGLRSEYSPTLTEANGQLGLGEGSLSMSPLENAIFYSPGSFRFGFGAQLFAWGSADGKNPTDVLNPRDYGVGLEAGKKPAFSVSALWYASESLSIEAVYVPITQADVFGMDFADLIPSIMPLTDVEARYAALPADFSSFTLGIRGRFRAGNTDFCLSAVAGWDPFFTPEIDLVLGTMPDPFPAIPAYVIQNIDLERRRLYTFGGDVKTTFGDFGLWLESALSVTDRQGDSYKVRPWKLSATLGCDVNFGASKQHYLNLQYFAELIPGYDADFSADYQGSQPDPLKLTDEGYMEEYYYRALTQALGLQTEGLSQGLIAKLSLQCLPRVLSADVETVLAVPLLYDDADGARLGGIGMKPSLDFSPADALHIQVGAELAYAWKFRDDGALTRNDETDRIGMFRKDNRLFLGVVYSWTYEAEK